MRCALLILDSQQCFADVTPGGALTNVCPFNCLYIQPIRTPGAVQGFGVLVVVEETEDALIVRQISEVSTSLVNV